MTSVYNSWITRGLRLFHMSVGPLCSWKKGDTPPLVFRGDGQKPSRWQRPEDWSEQELVRRLSENDPAAAAELIRRFGFLIRYLARNRPISHIDSDDLEQEAWVHLAQDNWRVVCCWEGRSQLSAYLAVVVTRRLRRILAAARYDASMTVPLEEAAGKSGSGWLSPEDRTVVRFSLERLTPNVQLALLLRVCDGLSHSEIASILGISVETSRQRVFSGLRKLERILAESLPHLMPKAAGQPRGIA